MSLTSRDSSRTGRRLPLTRRLRARLPHSWKVGRVLAVTVMLAGAFLAHLTSASAVHDVGVFELDRNAQNQASAGEDWQSVCPVATPAGTAGMPCLGNTTAKSSAFVIDPTGGSIFTGGSSKDDLDTTGWNHTAGSVPDKDEILHAFAARYELGNQSYLYFGADRAANNGDAQIGFWFFQGSVGPLANGTFGPGKHSDGDVLILSDFTKGGTLPTVRVFRWNGPGGSIPGNGAIDGTLDLLLGTTASPQDCLNVGNNDNVCATVNTQETPSPWAFVPKSGAANSFQPGELYEGGVNLSFLGLGGECFSSFLAETRTSQSVDSVLKDFAGGSFSACGAALTTVPSVGSGGVVVSGTQVTDTATVTGGGVTNPPTPTGSVSFSICGPVQSGTCSGGSALGSSVNVSGSNGVATATSAAFDTTGKTPGIYCFHASYSGDSNYPGIGGESNAANECFVVQVLPTTTQTSPSSATIALGGSVTDTAVVTGSSGGGDPAGTVAFSVCGPNTGLCTTGGTSVGTSKTLVSDGNASTFTSSATSDAFTPNAVGQWCFRADYTSTSSSYSGSSDSRANECFNVTDISSMTTAQDWLPNDAATITSQGGSILSGSVLFELLDGANCPATAPLYTESKTLTNAASPASVSTANATVKVAATKAVSWRVTFTSGNSTSGSNHCENTSLTITN